MPTIKELQEQRGTLVAKARAIAEKAKTEKREMIAEERTEFEKIMDVSLVDLGGQIEKLQKDEKRMAALDHLEGSEGRKIDPGTPGGGVGGGGGGGGAEKRSVLLGKDPITGRERRMNLAGPTSTDEYNRDFRSYLLSGRPSERLASETRALAADDDTAGGFLQAPQQFVAELIIFLNNLTYARQICKVLPPITGGNGVGIPSLDADVADADWTAEVATGSADSALTFGKRELKPHPLAKRVKISNKLIRCAAVDPETTVLERLGYKFAVTQEKAFMTGSGSNQNLGVFTASAQGISTGRDISTGNLTTSVTYDGLINAKYSIKGQYWSYGQGLKYLSHRDGLKQLTTLKDGVGRYLWMTGQNNAPDTVLSVPVLMSEYAPNTFTTGQYVGIFGNFGYYWIADALGMTVQVLRELYAETNQTGYIARLETDGAPVLEEAFARVKLG